MSDLLMTFTVFHTFAAIAVFGFMVFSAIKLVQGQFSSKG